jgi:biotin carboxyl carrier protein
MSRYTVTVDGRSFDVEFKGRVGSVITFIVAGEEYCVEVTQSPGISTSRKSTTPPRERRQGGSPDLRAPMPGIISEVKVAPGTAVAAGDVLVVIEAMKMENPIKAPAEAVVGQVLVQRGQEVTAGTILLTWQK